MAKKNLGDLIQKLNKDAGKNVAYSATDPSLSDYDVIPTGSLALDYALGTGGWPDRYSVHVIGPPDIGKSSLLGFGAIREAQKLGKACGLVAVEPGFDMDWAVKHGVDPDQLIVAHPDSGEEAFFLLQKMIRSGVIEYIVFDSIGALLRETETGEEAKANMAGQAGLITHGVKNATMAAFKQHVGIMYLNQVRDDMNPYAYDFKAPGGHALKHLNPIWVSLKPGKDRYTIKGADGENIIIGRSIICVVKRNKLNEGSDQRAQFDFYFKDTPDHPVGIDLASDVLFTAMRTGVIKAVSKSWYGHPSFDTKGNKLNGKKAVATYLNEHPEVVETIRKEVLEVMYKQIAERPKLKVVGDE